MWLHRFFSIFIFWCSWLDAVASPTILMPHAPCFFRSLSLSTSSSSNLNLSSVSLSLSLDAKSLALIRTCSSLTRAYLRARLFSSCPLPCFLVPPLFSVLICQELGCFDSHFHFLSPSRFINTFGLFRWFDKRDIGRGLITLSKRLKINNGKIRIQLCLSLCSSKPEWCDHIMSTHCLTHRENLLLLSFVSRSFRSLGS